MPVLARNVKSESLAILRVRPQPPAIPHLPIGRALGDSAENPRYGFFSGYLKNEKATEDAWRGGWFHTGDVVTQAATS